MRILPLGLLAAVLAPLASAQQPAPLDRAERWRYYWRHTYASPAVPLSAAYLAALWQWDDKPHDYGQGMAGYGRRLAEQAGRSVLRSSLENGTAAALGYEVRYLPCGCSGTAARLRHAATRGLITRDAHGHTRFNAPAVMAPVATEMIRQTWLPDGTRSNGAAARSASIQLGTRALVNVFSEFWPDLRRALRK
jgi:hypothetical protein